MEKAVDTTPKIQQIEAHLKLNPLDFKVWVNLYDAYEDLFLQQAREQHPNSIIRSPHCDLIAEGYLKGLGGNVLPKGKWDGSIYDWNGKQIQPPSRCVP